MARVRHGPAATQRALHNAQSLPREYLTCFLIVLLQVRKDLAPGVAGRGLSGTGHPSGIDSGPLPGPAARLIMRQEHHPGRYWFWDVSGPPISNYLAVARNCQKNIIGY